MVSPPVPMEVDVDNDVLPPLRDFDTGDLVLQPAKKLDENGDVPEAQADIIRRTEEANFPLESGAAQYIISTRWWNAWAAFTGFLADLQSGRGTELGMDSYPSPGPIDNRDLIDEEMETLKPNLEEGKDFVLRCVDTWNRLKGWYGGGPELQRQAWPSKSPGGKPVVDIYPRKFRILHDSTPEGLTLFISKHATVGDLKAKACAALELSETDVDLWDFFDRQRRCIHGGLTATIEAASLLDNQDLLLSPKDTKPKQTTPSASAPLRLTYESARTSGGYYYGDVMKKSPGRAGLANIGNTCYMNSSLQCLVHTMPFIRHYLSGKYKDEINDKNPMGCKGELAGAFGDLMVDLWQGTSLSVNPSVFKRILSHYAPQFVGSYQHDSQELLAFLLDKLHEDQNRVLEKPLIPERESDDRSDKELADEAWSNHRRRDDSFIVDHCQGFYKSTVICPQCDYRSVTFDIFMHLALPLPCSDERQVNVTVVTVDGSKMPTVYAVEVSKRGTVSHLYKALAKMLSIPDKVTVDQVLLIVEVTNSKVHRQLQCSNDSIPDLYSHGSFVAYLYPSPEVGPKAGLQEVVIFHSRTVKSQWSLHPTSQLFAAPLIVFMDRGKVEEAESLSVQVAGTLRHSASVYRLSRQ
eukprot:jgi/Botrbrau1/11571/Bobra.60_1s0022.1